MNNKETFEQTNVDKCVYDRPSTKCMQYFNGEVQKVYTRLEEGLKSKPDKGNTILMITGAYIFTAMLFGVLLTLYLGVLSSKVDQNSYDKDSQRLISIESNVNSLVERFARMETTLKGLVDTKPK